MPSTTTDPAPGVARWFSAHEPDACLDRLLVATGKKAAGGEALGDDEEAVGRRPQLKELKDGTLRVRPPRKLGGVLSIVTLRARLRRDDGGGTIFEVTRVRPRWIYLLAAPPFLVGLALVGTAIGSALWGVLPVAFVALAIGAALPTLFLRAGNEQVLRLADFMATSCDAVPFDDPPP